MKPKSGTFRVHPEPAPNWIQESHMRHSCLFGMALAGIFACGQTASAQSVIGIPTPIPVVLQQSYTTGMVGFTTNQTARLNVLNLNPVSATASATPNCSVQLQFFDGQNKMLKEGAASTLAPLAATSLDLKRVEVTAQTSPRAQIRGVVVINPTATTVAAPTTIGYCNVMTTLEIIDDVSGSTVALTSDTRALSSPLAFPLLGVTAR
jgi:hypothetical protein